ncbi:MAG: hypothetical protein ACRD97_03920 [Nitrososphaeraceae archaeon]
MSGTHQGNFIEKTITLKSKRVFLLKFIEFNNGCFVSLSEDLCKIGGLHVSVTSNNRTQSARVIPNIRDPIFVKTLSEKISLMINGIVITNFNNKNQLTLTEMQEIMNEVLKLLEQKTSE